MLTGRDAAHKRIADLYASGQGLPPGVDFTNRVIYYVGPVDPVRDEVVGPAGPTTATRMDKFTDMMLEKTGLIAMIGKSERGPVAIEAIRKHKAAYLMAVGGAAYLVSKAIRSSRVVAFGELGMEAIYEFDVKDMPVTVAVDAHGHVGAQHRAGRVVREDPHAEDPGPRRLTDMQQTDTLRRFVFERYPFRGQLVHLGPAWRAMMEHHDYPAAVRDSLGEAVAAAALLASTLKFKGQLSLQLRGAGPMHLMLVECTRRACTACRRAVPRPARDARPARALGQRDAHRDASRARPRQSLPGRRAARRRADERLPARVLRVIRAAADAALAARRRRAGERPAAAAPAGDVPAGGGRRSPVRAACSEDEIEDAWRRVQLVAGTVTDPELAELDDRELLRRLFAEDDVRMFEAAPVFFRCRCSRERVETMLRSLGRDEVDSIIAERGSGRGPLRILQPGVSLRPGRCRGAVLARPGPAPGGVH